jgi:hypothetical protein
MNQFQFWLDMHICESNDTQLSQQSEQDQEDLQICQQVWMPDAVWHSSTRKPYWQQQSLLFAKVDQMTGMYSCTYQLMQQRRQQKCQAAETCVALDWCMTAWLLSSMTVFWLTLLCRLTLCMLMIVCTPVTHVSSFCLLDLRVVDLGQSQVMDSSYRSSDASNVIMECLSVCSQDYPHEPLVASQLAGALL